MSDTTPQVSGRAGQAVRDIRTGKFGITTGDRAASTPTIGVIFLGGNYAVRMQLDELEPVTLAVVDAETAVHA